MAPKAEASLRLSLQDLGTGATVVLTESVDGFVTFNGAVGSFIVNVTTGVSTPILAGDQLDLNSLNVSGGSGTIRIILEDIYNANAGGVIAGIGGTVAPGGTLIANAWANTAAPLVPPLGLDTVGVEIRPIVDASAVGQHLVFSDTFGGGAFSGSAVTAIPKVNPYSMFMQVDITHTGAGQVSSFDFNLVNVPEPGTMAVALSGLPLLFIAWHRRKRNA